MKRIMLLVTPLVLQVSCGFVPIKLGGAPDKKPAPIVGSSAEDVDKRLYGTWKEPDKDDGTGYYKTTWMISRDKIQVISECHASLEAAKVDITTPVRIEKDSIQVLKHAQKSRQRLLLFCGVVLYQDKGQYTLSEDGNTLEIDWPSKAWKYEGTLTLTRVAD
ncbi:MAG: hypothetical protein AB7T49_05560 [Oligoflexales bacterium]